MLISSAKARDVRAGKADNVSLIPELCRPTGISDEMRTNFSLMRACADHTRLDPMNYKRRLSIFNQRLKSSPQSIKALNDFHLDIEKNLVEVQGAILPQQTILFADNRNVQVSNASWDNEFRNCKLYSSIELKNWFVICPRNCEIDGRKFMNDLVRVSHSMTFRYLRKF